MNVRPRVLLFVVGVRALLFVALATALSPAAMAKRRVQSNLWGTFPRVTRLRAWLAGHVSDRLPPWVEPRGGATVVLKTRYGMDRLDAIVERIPIRVVRLWRRFGVRTMEVFVFSWGFLLLAWLGVMLLLSALLVWLLGWLILAGIDWLLTFDWGQVTQPRPIPEFDLVAALDALVEALPALAAATADAVVGLVISFVITIAILWLLMLPLLPGLALHEFGHYVAARKAGASVENYGLLLWGPVLAGAFVQPGGDLSLLDRDETFGVWAGGIANSLLWGAALIAIGVSMGGDPVGIYTGALGGNYAPLLDRPVVSAVLLVGGVEVSNGFLNAAPLGPVDGGGFIRAVEREWWGFEDAIADALAEVRPG